MADNKQKYQGLRTLSAPAISGVNIREQQEGSKTQNTQQNTQQGQNGGTYTGLPGVSQNTAQQAGTYQQGYQPGDAVTSAQQKLQQINDLKPQGYTSRFGQQLDDILQKIQNPEQFKYTFNGDELFRSYADQYTQKGKQASLDAQGQAAGLTGGYGNSYGQQVGTQQYQQYLRDLYDKGIDLSQMAYQRYADDRADRYNQLAALSQADKTEYDRYRDDVADWENERKYLTDQYNTESDREYSRYADSRDYWTKLAEVENADYRSEQERQEAIRQFEMNFAEQQRQYDEKLAEEKRQWDQQFEYTKMSDERKYNYNLACAILQNGKMPSDAILKAAGIKKSDAKKMMKQAASGGSRGGSGGGDGETYYLGGDGKYYKMGTDGKWVEVQYKDIPKNAKIDTRYAKNQNSVGNTIRNAKETVDKVTEPIKNTMESIKKLLGL